MSEPQNLLPTKSILTQRDLMLTGIAGLVAAVCTMVACGWLVSLNLFPILVTGPRWESFLLSFVLAISLAEIPIMIIGMRQMMANDNPNVKPILIITNTSYVWFASIYAGGFLLLTGSYLLGSLAASLSVLRLITSLYFLRPKNSE